ncbi:Smg protein [Halanaerobium saccharolyticum]|uniref:Smg protein n=2 Tax=Halanaerobium saccharolyticum TaxID=43595 RepID=A0A4R7Z8A3_9FIRM|nr:Smg protein [Halanaerobium saccharolyticum]TDW06960.1 Smg protein [Halanaerobium saccharolyticum]TDX63725.1 Smg protein [Halanaerobium saccharolyticum]
MIGRPNRQKCQNNMNKKVIEILSILIHKMLNDEDLWRKQEDVIIELEDQGYTIENISEAFEVIFSEVISVEDRDFYIDYEMPSGYNRVFTKVENFYFSNEIKAIIYKLNGLGVLSADELEIIIYRMMQIASVDDLKADLVWDIINDVVDDSELMLTISAEINEFDSNLLKQQRVN